MINFKTFDLNLLIGIHKTTQNPFFDWFMPFVSRLGDAGLIWIIICIILLIQKKHRKTGYMCALALLLGTLSGELILKNIIGRARPFLSLPDIKLLIEAPGSFSFPSGHTTSSFAAATVIARNFRGYRIPAFFLAALIAFSRMYLFVHYPSDVLAGIILGIICARIGMIVVRKYIREDLT